MSSPMRLSELETKLVQLCNQGHANKNVFLWVDGRMAEITDIRLHPGGRVVAVLADTIPEGKYALDENK